MFSIEALILSILLLVLIVTGYTLYKVRRVDLVLWDWSSQAKRIADNTFRQLESLISLRDVLSLSVGLPATRGWAASPDMLYEIASNALQRKPICIIECSSGVSTIVLARCAQLNSRGRVYSLEHDKKYAAQTREMLNRSGLSDWAMVIDAPLCTHRIADKNWWWYSLNDLPSGGIDMLVIDGPPGTIQRQARYPAGPLLFPKLNPGAQVFLDDADREDERALAKRWRDEFPLFTQISLQAEKGLLQIGTPIGRGEEQ